MGLAAADAPFHVLAVDDSLIDRKLIERLLKTSSYQVTTVDSGSKALEFLGWNESSSDEAFLSPKNQQEVEVHLVITDYCMPGMTGYDLLKKMKESSILRNIPVVIMSSENVPSRINRCLEEGAEEFFLKPVRPSDVSKLKPHMMKTKCEETEKSENEIILAETEEIQIQTTTTIVKGSLWMKVFHQTEQGPDTIMASLLCPINLSHKCLLLFLFFYLFLFIFKFYTSFFSWGNM